MNTTTQEKSVETAAAVSNLPARIKPSLVAKFAHKFNIDPDKLLPILKATAFKQKPDAPEVTNEQMAALLIVADQYGLNPFTREIFAFPDKQNGIVPVVSVDGWARIINEALMMDGLEFRYSETTVEPGKLDGLKVRGHEWIECVIYRKDRSKPVVIREYLEEVYRAPFTFKDGNKKDSAWQTHTKRFHRHKALIQGARIAFGFAGLFDEDEANRIIEGTVLPTDPLPIEHKRGAAGLRDALGAGGSEVGTGGATGSGGSADSGATIPPQQKEKPIGTVEQRDDVVRQMKGCADVEVLALARDLANEYAWTAPDQQVIDEAYTARRKELEG